MFGIPVPCDQLQVVQLVSLSHKFRANAVVDARGY